MGTLPTLRLSFRYAGAVLVKLAIDFECPAPLWWKSGPDYAPSPVLLKPIEEDEV